MKSSFGRIFFPVTIILLSALLLVGLVFQVQAQAILKERNLTRLEENARTMADLAESYAQEPAVDVQDFLVNLSLAARVSEHDMVFCDSQGRLVVCSDAPLGCEHQGYMIDGEFLHQVKEKGVMRKTGKVQGLYPESRYLVSVPLQDQQGNDLGIVLVSTPETDTIAILNRMSEIYLFISILVILAAVLIMWFFVRRQSVPLRQLAGVARKFGHGDLDARARVSRGDSEEFRELALAFNNMASSLQKSEQQRQEFVANVSHELKTPMTTISGFVDGMLDGTIPPEKQDQYLSLVSDETKRLSRLVRSMLEISRLQDQGGIPEEKKLRFDLLETAGQVLITFERKILEKKLDVQVDMPELPVYAMADPDSITQVIYNLVDNAVKFCPNGGRLGLKIHCAGGKAYVSVSNEGPTIPPEELDMVFDRFHKLDKSRNRNAEGWGLGLYIVKTLVCSHGENISVSSRDGVTEFTFTLPQVN